MITNPEQSRVKRYAVSHGRLKDYRTEAGAVLDAIMVKRAWSQSEFAFEAKCDPSFISKLRSGDRTPSREWIDKTVRHAKLNRAEAAQLYRVYHFIPPGWRAIPPERSIEGIERAVDV